MREPVWRNTTVLWAGSRIVVETTIYKRIIWYYHIRHILYSDFKENLEFLKILQLLQNKFTYSR